MTKDRRLNYLSGAEGLVKLLDQHEVKYIFGLCGDTSLPFYDALYRLNHSIKHVLTRDERSASYMADAYAISDLLICRSGALTLAEITVCGKPAILIPFPHAAGDHQKKNAEALVKSGAAQILFEKSLTSNTLIHSIMNVIHNKEKLDQMVIASQKLGRPDATNDIVDHILGKTP